MYTLFDSIPTTGRGAIKFPEFLYVKGEIRRQQAEIVGHYHDNVKSVDSSHFLVKMLDTLNVSLSREAQNYVDVVSDQVPRIASAFQFSSPTSQGKVHNPGYLYGKHCNEIYVLTEEYFDLSLAHEHWRELTPIRVLRHDYSDLAMPILTKPYPNSKDSIAVIAINLPMLAFQYKRWFEEERSLRQEGENSTDVVMADSARTKGMFVAMYPIPNMVYSHYDIAVFNRLKAILFEEEVEDVKNPHPFHVTDISRKLDRILDKQSQVLKQRRLPFQDILLSVAMVNSATLHETMALPEMPITRQVKWPLIMARLPIMKFLVRLNDESRNKQNQNYINRIRISLKQIRNDRILASSLPRELLDEVNDLIDKELIVYL